MIRSDQTSILQLLGARLFFCAGRLSIDVVRQAWLDVQSREVLYPGWYKKAIKLLLKKANENPLQPIDYAAFVNNNYDEPATLWAQCWPLVRAGLVLGYMLGVLSLLIFLKIRTIKYDNFSVHLMI